MLTEVPSFSSVVSVTTVVFLTCGSGAGGGAGRAAEGGAVMTSHASDEGVYPTSLGRALSDMRRD